MTQKFNFISLFILLVTVHILHLQPHHRTATTSPAYHDGNRRPSKPRSKITSSPIPTFQFSLIQPISKLNLNPRKKTFLKCQITFDSSDFIKGCGARHTQPHSYFLRHQVDSSTGRVLRYVCLVDETFNLQQQELAPSIVSPLLKQYYSYNVVGACHGLLCVLGFHQGPSGYTRWMVAIWNPSIGKSFGIALPHLQIGTVFGFGVCPVTRDPMVVKILHTPNKPWHVELFTLSSGVWNELPSSNFPRQSIRPDQSTQVVIDRFIYWGASEPTIDDDGYYSASKMVVSFDLITKEFKVVDLPDTLINELDSHVSVSKLRESLIVSGQIKVEGALCCGVWVMEHDSSFKRLFTIGARVDKVLMFKNNGETIFETRKEDESNKTLDVYDPCSQQIKNLGISGVEGSFFMGAYKESLLLLDHSDLRIYSNNKLSKR